MQANLAHCGLQQLVSFQLRPAHFSGPCITCTGSTEDTRCPQCTHTHTNTFANTNAYTHICGPEHMQSLTLLQVHVHPTQRCPYLRVVCTQLGQQAVSYIEWFHCTPLHMQHTTQDCVVCHEPYVHHVPQVHTASRGDATTATKVWEALFPMATQHKAHTWRAWGQHFPDCPWFSWVLTSNL